MLQVITSGDQTNRFYHIEGILDISTSDLFIENVKEATGAEEVILDVTRMTFIDSTGIGAILELIYQLKEAGTGMQIIGMNEEIRDIFDTIGVLRVMDALQRGRNECQNQ